MHFLMQSTPNHSPSEIIRKIKSITGRQIFLECPEVKKWLWGGQFSSDGYFVGSVGKNQNEKVIQECIKNQGQDREECKRPYLFK